MSVEDVVATEVTLAEIQDALALEHGYPSWDVMANRASIEKSAVERLSAPEMQTFAERGLIKVDGLIPDAIVSAARDYVYRRLSSAQLWTRGNWSASQDDVTVAKRVKTALKGCSESALFRDLLTAEVLAIARQLVGGEEVTPTPPMMQLLFTPPNAAEWTLPYNMWHVDLPRMGDLGWAGVQMFTFLDTVAPRGGGSLEVAGSHRLLNDVGVIPSKAIRRRLAREEYFRALTDKNDVDRRRFMDEVGYIGGVELQVVELTGEPGDVYFADLRLLHSIAPNASQKPRAMITQRLPRASVAEQMDGIYEQIYERRQARRAEKADS